jgi:hypothetical protein
VPVIRVERFAVRRLVLGRKGMLQHNIISARLTIADAIAGSLRALPQNPGQSWLNGHLPHQSFNPRPGGWYAKGFSNRLLRQGEQRAGDSNRWPANGVGVEDFAALPTANPPLRYTELIWHDLEHRRAGGASGNQAHLRAIVETR